MTYRQQPPLLALATIQLRSYRSGSGDGLNVGLFMVLAILAWLYKSSRLDDHPLFEHPDKTLNFKPWPWFGRG